MKSDIITINSNGQNMETALNEVEKVAAYKSLTGKNVLHLRLLGEELMGMMRSITGETEGKFWIETEGDVYQLHLDIETLVDAEKRKQLLAASRSGKNEASKGLMGRLREFFFRSANEDIAAFSNPILSGGAYREGNMPVTDWQWSMVRYVDRHQANQAPTEEEKEAWDELEKSVVSHVADDVKISIRGWQTEMVLTKIITAD